MLAVWVRRARYATVAVNLVTASHGERLRSAPRQHIVLLIFVISTEQQPAFRTWAGWFMQCWQVNPLAAWRG